MSDPKNEWDELEVLLDDRLVKLLLLTLRDVDGERAADLKSSLEAHGETKEKFRERFLCEFGQHEAMDRSFIAQEHVDSYLLHHPYVLFTPKAYQLATIASMVLAELYQECGRADYTQGNPKCLNSSQPSPSGRGFLSRLKSYYSSFWSKLIREWEQESAS